MDNEIYVTMLWKCTENGEVLLSSPRIPITKELLKLMYKYPMEMDFIIESE